LQLGVPPAHYQPGGGPPPGPGDDGQGDPPPPGPASYAPNGHGNEYGSRQVAAG
jgi:hypothetical protein